MRGRHLPQRLHIPHKGNTPAYAGKTKARGVHELDGDADIVRSLVKQGMSDADICQHLGIDAETELRYKQLTGIVELFRKVNYSVSWSSDGDEKDGDDAVKPAKS